MAHSDLEGELASLASLSLAKLREKWRSVSENPLPRVSAGLLRHAIASELQAKAHGNLSRATQQRLDQIAAGKTQTHLTEPGMRLTREWNGTLHIVTIGDDGAIEWNGKNWKSLSAVARAITGTRWSGPAFFGLKTRKRA